MTAFTEQALVLRNASQDGDAIRGERVNYDDVTLLDIGGPGEATTGGGVIGGGFGSGVFIGMMAAAVANALTTKTSIDTVICLQTRNAELFLHHSGVDRTSFDVRFRRSSASSVRCTIGAPTMQPAWQSSCPGWPSYLRRD